ncbi:GFA family protein [Arenimonas sp. GDDSR-1]|uniref:GFA family protein n=1 Tax=Arenimonas sp. GDDSR-1 TaxID=2950125 RepID=UPI002610950C|nr:GFA family protein [Arenimonas sp. GDDSR-1]
MPRVHGSCLCGALKFSVALPSLWMAHCHCTLCQKNAGAAFVTWAGFAEADAVIEDEADVLRWYSATENAYRGFCENCGSTLFFKSERWPGELHITVVNFADALDRVPQAHVNWDTHQLWLHLDDGLPHSPE